MVLIQKRRRDLWLFWAFVAERSTSREKLGGAGNLLAKLAIDFSDNMTRTVRHAQNCNQ